MAMTEQFSDLGDQVNDEAGLSHEVIRRPGAKLALVCLDEEGEACILALELAKNRLERHGKDAELHLPGGASELDPRTGMLRSDVKTLIREIGEELPVSIDPDQILMHSEEPLKQNFKAPHSDQYGGQTMIDARYQVYVAQFDGNLKDFAERNHTAIGNENPNTREHDGAYLVRISDLLNDTARDDAGRLLPPVREDLRAILPEIEAITRAGLFVGGPQAGDALYAQATKSRNIPD